MNERAMQFRVGLVVVVTLGIATVLVLLFARPSTVFEEYLTVYVDSPQAPGVSTNSPVRKNGILVGRVTEVQLVDHGARMKVGLLKRYQDKVRRNEIFRIGGGSLIGDTELSVVPSGDPSLPDQPVQEGDTLRGMTRIDPLQVVGNVDAGLDRVVRSVSAASDAVAMLAQRLSTLVEANDSHVNNVLARTADTLDSVRSMTQNVDGFVSDPQLRDSLTQTLKEMPALLREAREATTQIRETAMSADRSFVNVQKATDPLADNGRGLVEKADELFQKLGRSADRMEELVENLLLFSQALNRSDGTLGKLIHDPRLYNNLTAATDQINSLAIELRPVLYNARLFTDQIARNPEKLGVRGALEGGSSAVKPVPGACPP
jgi:phospholipid/cholesterol/gamma-HCH transport system substrate-binding protein